MSCSRFTVFSSGRGTGASASATMECSCGKAVDGYSAVISALTGQRESAVDTGDDFCALRLMKSLSVMEYVCSGRSLGCI